MKSKIFITVFFVLPFYILAFPQSLPQDSLSVKGKIIQKDNSQPLSYVSIGILNQPLGTLTDTLGNFNFQISKQNLKDTLQISMVGYFSMKISVKEFIERKEKSIKLNVKIEELPKIVVTSGKANIEIIGRLRSGKFIQVSIHNKKSVGETIGSEMGMRYKTKQTNAILKDFNFYISANNFNYIKYRLNIYSVKDDMPDTLIINKQIFMSVIDYKTGWTKVDLEDYNIKINRDFIVTVQWVESRMDKKENPVTLIPVAMTPFSKNCYTRIASQDKWKKVGIYLSNYVTLVY